MKTGLLPILALIWFFSTGAAAPVRMTPVKVTDGVYMFEHSQGSGNSTVVITNDGVVVLDFHIDNADQTLAGIRKLTDKKVKYLITSHSAGDHASGSWHFREDNPVWIATKNQIHDLQMQERKGFNERKNSNDPRYAAYKKAEQGQPDHRLRRHDDALLRRPDVCQITAEGRGHSTGDLTVYIPQKRVMLMGDLFDTEIHPGQGESGEIFYSNVQGWINILDNIMARNLAVETYIPGHGPVHIGRGVKDLEEQKRYFVVMRDEVAKMVQAGKTLEQIEKEFKIPQEFAHYKRPERLRQFLQTLLSSTGRNRLLTKFNVDTEEKHNEMFCLARFLSPRLGILPAGHKAGKPCRGATGGLQQTGSRKGSVRAAPKPKAKSRGTLRWPAARTRISPPPSRPDIPASKWNPTAAPARSSARESWPKPRPSGTSSIPLRPPFRF